MRGDPFNALQKYLRPGLAMWQREKSILWMFRQWKSMKAWVIFRMPPAKMRLSRREEAWFWYVVDQCVGFLVSIQKTNKEPLPPTPIALLLRRIIRSLAQLPDCNASKRRLTFRSVIRLSKIHFYSPFSHWRSRETSSLKYPASITKPRSWIHFRFVIVATIIESFVHFHIPDDEETHRNETDDTNHQQFDTMSYVRHSTSH